MQYNFENISKEQAKKLMLDKIYGNIPKKPRHLDIEITLEDDNFAAGRAIYRKEMLILETEESIINIPFISVIPLSQSPVPAIISLNFESNVPNKFLPAEEISDRGYALFSLCIDDITSNDPNFKLGIYGKLVKSRKKNTSPGKIALWAYAAIVLCDHISKLGDIDESKIGISGHDVCAKAAMLAAGLDERIDFVISNNAFAAFSPVANPDNVGSVMAYDHPYLFCPAFADEPVNEEPYIMMRLCNEKKILVGCAKDDLMANYTTEYEILRKSRFCERGNNLPKINEKSLSLPFVFENDDTSFHLRGGRSYFGREDWNIYLDFLDKKLKNTHF